MNFLIKKIVIVIIIIIVLSGIFFGSLLPIAKSRRYINFLQTVPNAPLSLNDLKKELDKVTRFYSPIGQEEVVRYIGNDILNVVVSGNQQEIVNRELAQYIELHLFKNDIRHLIIIGELHRALWMKYGKEEDYKKSEEVYLGALEMAPKFPLVLNNLFDLYGKKGDKEKMKKIGAIILNHWPNDEKVKSAMNFISD